MSIIENQNFDIAKFINENKIIKNNEDYGKTLEDIISNSVEKFHFMATIGYLEKIYKSCPDILTGYHLTAMFDMEAIKDGKVVFYEFQKDKPEFVKVALRVKGAYSMDGVKLAGIWLNDNNKPENLKNYEFYEIPYDEINKDALYPKEYNPLILAIKNYIKQKATLKLSDVADIIIPIANYNKKGNILEQEYCVSILNRIKIKLFGKNQFEKYGFKKARGCISNCELQQGDIVIDVDDFEIKACYISQNISKIYAQRNHIVLRTKVEISPEYLCSYLNSNIGYFIYTHLISGIVYECSTTNLNEDKLKYQINNFPIIPATPTQTIADDTEYNEICAKFSQYAGTNVFNCETIIDMFD